MLLDKQKELMRNLLFLSTNIESYKDETAVHGCHYSSDMAVRMREVMATPRSCVL